MWEQERKDLPLIYLWTGKNIVGMKKALIGFQQVPDGLIRLQGMEMKWPANSILKGVENARGYTRGSRTTNRAPITLLPIPRRFSAVIRPRSASMICRLIDRPSPECWPNFSPCGRSE